MPARSVTNPSPDSLPISGAALQKATRGCHLPTIEGRRGHPAQFEDGPTTSDDGTDFGLSIVRSIVEAHGWDIDSEGKRMKTHFVVAIHNQMVRPRRFFNSANPRD